MKPVRYFLSPEFPVYVHTYCQALHPGKFPFLNVVLSVIFLNLNSPDGTFGCINVGCVMQRLISFQDFCQLLQTVFAQPFP